MTTHSVNQPHGPIPKRKRIAASELLEQLAGDPGYQTRRAALDAKRMVRNAQVAIAARPLVDDLRAIGAPVTYEQWDIRAGGRDYRYALPVLCKHLYIGASDPIPEYVARAMALPSAATYRSNFIELFRQSARSSGFRSGLAVAIAATTTKESLSETVALLRDKTLGPERLLLLLPLRRSRQPLAIEALQDLRQDPDLALELGSWARFRKQERHAPPQPPNEA